MNVRARNGWMLSALLGAVFAVVACAPIESDLPEAATVLPVEPVSVKRGSVASVLTIPAVSVVQPRISVRAAQSGIFWIFDGLEVGSSVKKGQTIGFVGELPLVAPLSGRISEWLVEDGAEAFSGVPLISLQHPGFGARATVDPSLAFRLYEGTVSARVQFDGGPGIVDCDPQMPVIGDESASQEGDAGLEIVCLVGDTEGLVAGLSGVLALFTGEAHDVLTLPISAVAGDTQHGRVAQVTGTEATIVDVGLGISDGLVVEITSGLEEGDLVLPFGPDLAQSIK